MVPCIKPQVSEFRFRRYGNQDLASGEVGKRLRTERLGLVDYQVFSYG
jgi:hypothetical protein